jgi:hypothetical protein
MDGSIAGDGPGPRAMRPQIANLLLASNDMVSIDATAARLMGIDPMSLKYIRLAHEAGLGVGDPAEIELVGDDVSNVNLKFSPGEDTMASRGQKLIYWGPLKPLEHLLLRTPIVPWAFAASRLYHDAYWYPFVGKPRVEKILESDWGKLFHAYGAGQDRRGRLGGGRGPLLGGEERAVHAPAPRQVRLAPAQVGVNHMEVSAGHARQRG